MILEDGGHQQQPKRIETSQSSGVSEEHESFRILLSEVIVEILTRLPVESLLRCKSVCKLWRSIISDPNFIKSHLKLTINRNNYADSRLIFSTVPSISLKTCNLSDVLYDKSINGVELDYPLKTPSKEVWLAGSCNGLLCIAIEEDTLLIWNPSTRRSNRLPYCSFKSQPGWYPLYGFGYDPLTDDYKVVGISCVLKKETEYDTKVKIYSMKTGNWKEIGAFPHGIPLDDCGSFSNGAVHWAATREIGSSTSWTIVSLGLRNELYAEVPQPVYDNGDKDLALGIIGENLCVVCNYCGKCADVWVMKVYGQQDSWTKLISVPYLPGHGKDQFSVPLCLSDDGKVMLQFGSKLVLYDSKNGLFSEIQNFKECLETYTYIESLVSPDSPTTP